MSRKSLACGFVGLALSLAVSPVSAALIASSGFNDAAGLHSDPTPDSPFELGATAYLRGVGEPGWASGWVVSAGGGAGGFGSHLGIAQGDVVHEGDGALRMQNRVSPFQDLWVYRRWSDAQTSLFRIDQWVNIPAGGQFGSRPFQSGSGDMIPRIGPSWSASNGMFFARDGDGAGSTTSEFSGFTWEPDTWYKVSLVVDVPNQSFEFYVDDQKYESPDPLNFRGTPTAIDTIEYLSSAVLYVDEITITGVPEPSTVVLLLGCGLLSLCFLTRRRVASLVGGPPTERQRRR